MKKILFIFLTFACFINLAQAENRDINQKRYLKLHIENAIDIPNSKINRGNFIEVRFLNFVHKTQLERGSSPKWKHIHYYYIPEGTSDESSFSLKIIEKKLGKSAVGKVKVPLSMAHDFDKQLFNLPIEGSKSAKAINKGKNPTLKLSINWITEDEFLTNHPRNTTSK